MDMNFLFYLREYLFPSGCGICGRALFNSMDAYYGLCGECRKFLSGIFEGDKTCKTCGKPLITEKGSCLECRKKDGNGAYNEYIERMRTFFPYSGKFQNLLGAYKFHKSKGVGNYLASCLTGVLPEINLEGDAAWVPVPPRPGKIRKQGWDQIEYLSGLLEKEHRRSFRGEKVPVNRCLKRLPSRTQKELNREERNKNLKGRILCIKKPPRIAILFDDVITTGATLNACAAALLEGGAEKVYGVCLFYD